MIAPGCLALIILFFLFIVPFIYAEIMLTAMTKLGLSSPAALMIVVGVLFGSLINIPVRRIPSDVTYEVDRFQLYGISHFFPRMRRRNSSTIIAVNVGGCVIPCLVALFQLLRMLQFDRTILLAALVVSLI